MTLISKLPITFILAADSFNNRVLVTDTTNQQYTVKNTQFKNLQKFHTHNATIKKNNNNLIKIQTQLQMTTTNNDYHSTKTRLK